MKIHALEVLLSSYSSAYTTLLSAGIDDTVVTHLKSGWYKMLSKSKISPKENVSWITAVSFWIRFLSFIRNIQSTLKIKKTTDRLHTLERPKKKTIGFFTCKKLPRLIGLHTCFQHTAKPPFFFHCEWSCPMEAGAISWALPPHLGTFHISSLCAGVNDAVVADLQVLGPKLLICHVFFGTTISLHNKKQLVNTKYKQRSRAAIFCKKKQMSKGFCSTQKIPHFYNTNPSNRNELFRVRFPPSKVQLWIKPRWAWGHCLASKWAILPPSEVSSKDVGPGETKKSR